MQSMYHLRGYELSKYIEAVSPTLWLLVQGDDDNTCTPDVGLSLFEQTGQPKESLVYQGGLFSCSIKSFLRG